MATIVFLKQTHPSVFINHRPLVITDGCSKCCELNSVSLTCGSLPVLPYKNDSGTKDVSETKNEPKSLYLLAVPCNCNSCSARTQQI